MTDTKTAAVALYEYAAVQFLRFVVANGGDAARGSKWNRLSMVLTECFPNVISERNAEAEKASEL